MFTFIFKCNVVIFDKMFVKNNSVIKFYKKCSLIEKI